MLANILRYKAVRVNLLLFIGMLVAYYVLYTLKSDMFSIDNEYNNTNVNYDIVDIFYFTTMMHTHVAIGDITPSTWYLKIIVSLHVLVVWIMTYNSIIDDNRIIDNNRMEENNVQIGMPV